VEEMGDDVLVDGQVALIDLTGKGERIQVLDGRSVRSVDHLFAIQETDPVNPLPLQPLTKLFGRIIEFTAADDVDGAVGKTERLFGEDGDMRAGKHRHGGWFLLLDPAGGLAIDEWRYT